MNEKLAISSQKDREDQYYHDLILENVKESVSYLNNT